MSNTCIVVSGLPARGKSTIGNQLADAPQFGFLDKDDYLERLYEERGVGRSQWRRALSKESDTQFIRDAKSLESAVLVSHWKAIRNSNSGTSIEWLSECFTTVLELYCSSGTEIALSRFLNRE